jgi:molybdenum cofactor biosynthesis enzyme MoaA
MVKLYVIPVESACNATCPYCINKFRDLGNSFLSLDGLEKCLNEIGTLDSIEISGGGEPTLHPQIEKIIGLCVSKTRTQMYTNGSVVGLLSNEILRKLNPLCISRAHYDSEKNEQIMGVKYSDEIFSRGLNLKLSAVLFKGGIDSVQEVENYISWAIGKAQKVVFRQLFSDVVYPLEVAKKIISIDSFVKFFIGDTSLVNPSINMGDMEVEFETRSCGCENINPILHADGKLNYIWGKDDTDREGNPKAS